MSRKSYDTPKRTVIIKTRLTEEEKKRFDERCRTLQISHSDFIRQVIFEGRARPTIIFEGNGTGQLEEISRLLAECSRIGNNLNQIARHLNSGGAVTADVCKTLRDGLADLAAFRLRAEKVIGECYGDHKAYQL